MFDKLKNMLSLDQWIRNFEGYLDARIDLVKFDVKELLVSVLRKVVLFGAIGLFFLVGFISLNFGLAYFLNEMIGNQYAGFLILTGFYFLIALVFYWLRSHEGINQKLELIFRDILKQPVPEIKPDDNGSDR